MNTGTAQIFFLLLLVAFFYFMIVRPQRNRMRQQQQLQSSLQLGDEIITFAGFIGTIRRFDGDVVTIELSPGVEARLNRRAISGKVTPADHGSTEDEDLEETDEVDEADEADVDEVGADQADDREEPGKPEASKP
jgi:preprotein translocase subunit YajC